jgi:hypothetical protein
VSDLKIPVWGLCPFRSPVVPPTEKPSVFAPNLPAPQPTQALGPCLYAGCGLWKITKVENGKPVDGMCSLRYAAECAGELTGAIQVLVKLAMKSGAVAGLEVPSNERPS